MYVKKRGNTFIKGKKKWGNKESKEQTEVGEMQRGRRDGKLINVWTDRMIKKGQRKGTAVERKGRKEM